MIVERLLCPWCMQTMIDPEEGICPRCYAQEEPLEQQADYEQVRTLGQMQFVKIPYDQTLASLHADFFTFWCSEDRLDWSWRQYFELTAGNLTQYVPQDTLLQIMAHHFGDILAQPVQRMRNDRRLL